MGEAKRRGTRVHRIAQAIERKKIEDAALHERYLAQEDERRAGESKRREAADRREALFTREKPVVVVGGGHARASLLLASMAGLLAAPSRNVPILIADLDDDAMDAIPSTRANLKGKA